MIAIFLLLLVFLHGLGHLGSIYCQGTSKEIYVWLWTCCAFQAAVSYNHPSWLCHQKHLQLTNRNIVFQAQFKGIVDMARQKQNIKSLPVRVPVTATATMTETKTGALKVFMLWRNYEASCYVELIWTMLILFYSVMMWLNLTKNHGLLYSNIVITILTIISIR